VYRGASDTFETGIKRYSRKEDEKERSPTESRYTRKFLGEDALSIVYLVIMNKGLKCINDSIV